MADIEHPIEDFATLVRPLVGLAVSLPWQGCAGALFVELGDLTPNGPPERHHPGGEACIATNWEWRVEKDAAVLFGSADSSPEIEDGIRVLMQTKVESLSLEQPVSELVVRFSNGWRLRTVTISRGDPDWAIKLPGDDWLYVRKGSLRIGEGTPEVSERERAAFALSDRTAERWGGPVVEPKNGECAGCCWFVRLDGTAYLLDYGVCIADGGPLDGRVVKTISGCPRFTDDEDMWLGFAQ